MANFKQAFGLNLKLLRKSRNFTQEKLSELIDIHTRQLSKIETGEHFPSCKTLEKICIVLQAAPKDLFNFDIESELAMTGTDDQPYFKAVRTGNVVYLHRNNSGQHTIEKTDDAPDKMTQIAKDLDRPIIVEYFEDGKSSGKVIYNPDGSIENQNNTADKEYEANIRFMLDKFKKFARDKQCSEFIKLSLNSLESSEALEKLSIIIEGMKLARRK